MRKDNKGMTMVEIVISFAVLSIVMLIIYNCIKFSGNLMKEATDIDREYQAYQSAVSDRFKQEGAYELGKDNSVTFHFAVKDGSGAGFDNTLYYSDVVFEKKGASFEVSAGGSGKDTRTLRVFSTGDAGSSGTKIKHRLTYKVKKGTNGNFTNAAVFTFDEGVGVSEEFMPNNIPSGYSFNGWFTNVSLTTPATGLVDITKALKADLVVYGEYVLETTKASYSIEYLMEKPDFSGYVLSDESVVIPGATVGSTVEIQDSQKKAFPGYYCYDTGNNILSVKIKSDNSSKLVIYYNRCVYTLTYDIRYSDGTSSIKMRDFSYGGYDSSGELIDSLLSKDPGTGATIENWYLDEAMTKPYGITDFRKETEYTTLYTYVDKANGVTTGVDNMENTTPDDKLSKKLPDLTTAIDNFENDFKWHPGAWPYKNDGNTSHARYELIKPLINAAMEGFGYSTSENVFITADGNQSRYRLYILDTSETTGINLNLNSDMTLAEMYETMSAYTGPVNKQNAGALHNYCYIELPEDKVAVYETTDYKTWEKLNVAEEPTLYLVFKLNKYNANEAVSDNSEAYISESAPW